MPDRSPRAVRALLGVACLALAPSPAHAWVIDLAADGTRAGTTDDGLAVRQHAVPARVLAEREGLTFLGPRGAVIRARGIACQLSLGTGSGVLSAAYDACESVFDIAPATAGGTGHVDLQVQQPPAGPVVARLTLARAPATGRVIVADDGALFLDGPGDHFPAGSFWLDGRWWPAEIDPRSRRVTAEDDAGAAALDAWVRAPDELLVIRTEATGTRLEQEWLLPAEEVPPLAPAEVLVPEDPATWCQPEAGPRASHTLLVCVNVEDLAVRTRRYDRQGRSGHVGTRTLPSDHAVELIVRHPSWTVVGTRLEEQGPDSDWAMVDTTADDPGLVAATRRVTRRRYAPRPHGALHLEVTGDSAVIASEELTVVPRYIGALRLGLGAVTPAQGTYELTPTETDGIGQISRTSGLVEGELVVGWATFLDPGGRDYLDDEPLRWAPYVGLGVLGADSDRLRFTFLQSIHLGLELELAPVVSIAPTFTLRRVDRLAGGWEVGDQTVGDQTASDTWPPTSSAYRPGLGVVVGLSPEVLRIKARRR